MTPPTDEDGFTLIELLLAIVITSIVASAIGSAMVVGLKTTFFTARKLNVSGNAQLLSQYLVPDVLSATTVNGAYPCAGSPSGTAKLTLSWTDAASGTAYGVSYRLDGSTLQRYSCTGGGTATVATVAHDVTDAPAATLTATTVAMTVTVHDPEAASGAEEYTFTVSAARRAVTTGCTPDAGSVIATSGNPATLAGGGLTGNVVFSFTMAGTCSTPPTAAYTFDNTTATRPATPSDAGGGNWTVTVPNGGSGWTSGTKSMTITAPGGTASGTFTVNDPNACVLVSGPAVSPTTAYYSSTAPTLLVTPVTVTFTTQGTCGSTGAAAIQYGSTTAQSVTVNGTGVPSGTSTAWTVGPFSTPGAGLTWTAGSKAVTAVAGPASGSTNFTVAVVIPCTVTNVNLDQPNAYIASGGASGRLVSDVTATITTAGTCTASDLVLTYDVGTVTTTTAPVTGSGTSWTATVSATALASTWTAGSKSVSAKALSTLSTSGTTLTVRTGCAVLGTPTMTPNPVNRTGGPSGGNLNSNVVVSFTTTGLCTSTNVPVVYEWGTSSQTGSATVAAPTTNSNGTKSWTATISKNASGENWTTGTKKVTVATGAAAVQLSLVVQ